MGTGVVSPVLGGIQHPGVPGGMAWCIQSPGIMGLLEPLILWATWRMKGTILSLPGTHPAHLHGGNGFKIVFPTNKLVFNESKLKVGLFATKRGVEVEDWGSLGSCAQPGVGWALQQQVLGVPVLTPSQECGLLSRALG